MAVEGELLYLAYEGMPGHRQDCYLLSIVYLQTAAQEGLLRQSD